MKTIETKSLDIRINKHTGEIYEDSVRKPGPGYDPSPSLYKRPRVYADLDLKTSIVQQQFKDECDINNIMKTYAKTGFLPELINRDPSYGDFSSSQSFQDSLHVVIKAQEQFEALSSDIRERFMNDPARFLAFANDPKNLPKLVEMGLATEVLPTPEAPPQKVQVVNPIDPEPTSKSKSKT